MFGTMFFGFFLTKSLTHQQNCSTLCPGRPGWPGSPSLRWGTVSGTAAERAGLGTEDSTTDASAHEHSPGRQSAGTAKRAKGREEEMKGLWLFCLLICFSDSLERWSPLRCYIPSSSRSLGHANYQNFQLGFPVKQRCIVSCRKKDDEETLQETAVSPLFTAYCQITGCLLHANQSFQI